MKNLNLYILLLSIFITSPAFASHILQVHLDGSASKSLLIKGESPEGHHFTVCHNIIGTAPHGWYMPLYYSFSNARKYPSARISLKDASSVTVSAYKSSGCRGGSRRTKTERVPGNKLTYMYLSLY
jgi:hypothetical protein